MKNRAGDPGMVSMGGWMGGMCVCSAVREEIGNVWKRVRASRVRTTEVWAWVLAVIVSCGQAKAESELRLGGAINLFSRYGYLSISMRVVPRNDTDSKWLYREPTIDIFKDLSALTLAPVNQNKVKVFEGDFHMEFCDNLRQLLQAYFRDFNFEKLDRPWRAFSGSWSRSGMARHLGIDSNYITGHYCYVLVRVARHRDSGRMRPVGDDVLLEEEVARGTNEVIPGDEASVTQFVKSFGSHYVVSYTTGNSLYQLHRQSNMNAFPKIATNPIKKSGTTCASLKNFLPTSLPFLCFYLVDPTEDQQRNLTVLSAPFQMAEANTTAVLLRTWPDIEVFVYTTEIYLRIKERLKTKGVGDLSTVELSSYFSPWYAEHIGEIQSASGNASIQGWAAQNLRVHFYFFTYPSLLKLHGDMDLLRHLNDLLGNEAMLALDLRTIAPAFKDPAKRKWFLEVIDNYLKLWETNM